MNPRPLPMLVRAFGLACSLFILDSLPAQVVFSPSEVQITSTAGLVNVTSASGTKVANLQVPTASGEKPTTATHRPGAVIETGPDSQATVSIPGAGSMLLGSETQVRLPKTGDKGQSLELLKGKLFLNISAEEVKKRGDASFRLKTPAALLAVKGTKFFASVQKTAETCGVHEGTIGSYVIASRQLNEVQAGKVLTVLNGKPEPLRPLTDEERREAINYELAVSEGRITNSLGMKFAAVPGTKVLFCIHETRRKDYDAYAAEVPGVDDSSKVKLNGIPSDQAHEHPMISVSWEECVKFCEWLSKKEGKTYRLPTDEEWSIAVGLGGKEKHGNGITPEMLDQKQQREFPWGGDYPPKTEDKAENYADSVWMEKFPNEPGGLKDYTDGFPTTAPVMSFKPNKLGLYDMGGNVMERVEAWWDAEKTSGVQRGASFSSYDRGRLLSSYRHRRTAGCTNCGFRVVMVVR